MKTDLLILPAPAAPNVNVTVQQRPNDAADAARLYGELQAKAHQSFLEAFTTENHRFSVKVAIERDFANEDLVGYAITVLNGRRMQVDFRLQEAGEYGDRRRKLILGLRDKLAKVIAEEMLVEGFTGLK
jgi:hypothetical protein